MRVKSDFWVAAWLRRCNSSGASAVLRRRGAAEAGAIFVLLDTLDGNKQLYGPAPQSAIAPEQTAGRVFARVHKPLHIDAGEAEQRLAKQASYDPDIWIAEVEDREGRCFLDLADST